MMNIAPRCDQFPVQTYYLFTDSTSKEIADAVEEEGEVDEYDDCSVREKGQGLNMSL